MQEWFQSAIQPWLQTHLPPLILALMGGVADYIMSDDHSWVNMIAGVFLAGFTGYMVLLLCIEYNLSEAWMGITCGISGLSSRAILKLMSSVVQKKIAVMLQTTTDTESVKKE